MSHKQVSGNMGRSEYDTPADAADVTATVAWMRGLVEPQAHRTIVVWTHEARGMAQFMAWCRTCQSVARGPDKAWLEEFARDHEENN